MPCFLLPLTKSTFNEALRSCSPVGSSPSGQVPAGDGSQPHGPPLVLETPSPRCGGRKFRRRRPRKDALDPLLIEDALDHSSAVDIARMRTALGVMRQSADDGDATAFVRAHGNCTPRSPG